MLWSAFLNNYIPIYCHCLLTLSLSLSYPAMNHRFPLGVRFHPTDEELIVYNLEPKITDRTIERDIPEIDLYKHEPWDLPGMSLLPGKEKEWYFFTRIKKKYPNGSKINRATKRGYWNSSGSNQKVHSHKRLVGMKKTLIYYEGKAPRGSKTNWMMHEYRLPDSLGSIAPSTLKDSYVLCRVFKKTSKQTFLAQEEETTVNIEKEIVGTSNEQILGDDTESSHRREAEDNNFNSVDMDFSSDLIQDMQMSNYTSLQHPCFLEKTLGEIFDDDDTCELASLMHRFEAQKASIAEEEETTVNTEKEIVGMSDEQILGDDTNGIESSYGREAEDKNFNLVGMDFSSNLIQDIQMPNYTSLQHPCFLEKTLGEIFDDDDTCELASLMHPFEAQKASIAEEEETKVNTEKETVRMSDEQILGDDINGIESSHGREAEDKNFNLVGMDFSSNLIQDIQMPNYTSLQHPCPLKDFPEIDIAVPNMPQTMGEILSLHSTEDNFIPHFMPD